MAYYPFNGNADDESGNGNNGIVNGATLTEDRFGDENKAYSFDGVDDIILVPSSSSLTFDTKLTISVWFKPAYTTTSSTYSQFVNKWHDGGTTRGVSLEIHHNKLGWHISENSCYAPEQPISQDWHFLIGVWNGSNMNLFLDNESIANISTSGIFQNQSVDLGIGGDPNPLGLFFEGEIDDARIYNRALSESEIQQLYNKNGSDVPSGDCSEESTLVENEYLGACEVDDESEFILGEESFVSRIKIWYDTSIGGDTLRANIYGPDGYSWSGSTIKERCQGTSGVRL